MKNALVIILTLALLISLFDEVFAQSPDELNSQGVQSAVDNDLYQAMNDFEKAISVNDKKAAMNYHNIGYIFEEQQNIAEAINNYEEAIKRNPVQIQSYERAGYLNFKQKNMEKAIAIGEGGLKVDPKNKEIPKWLFKAKIEQEKKVQQAKDALIRERDKDTLKREKVFIKVDYSFVLRTAYIIGSGYQYVDTPGLLINIPNILFVDFTPLPDWQFLLTMGNPYLGGLAKNTVIWTEHFEAIYYKEGYFLGLGFLGNHYDGSSFFKKTQQSLFDFKFGLVFGFYEQKARFDFTWYPRLLPYDAGYEPNKTYDTNYMNIAYKYRLTPKYNLLLGFTVNEYYFFDHKIERSDYFGVYDLSISIRMFDKPDSPFIVEAGVVEKYYTEDYNNKNPYSFLNGQGYFGINKDKWVRGDPVSGFKTIGQVIFGKMEHKLGKNFYLHEKLMIELVMPSQKEYDISVEIGGKVVF